MLFTVERYWCGSYKKTVVVTLLFDVTTLAFFSGIVHEEIHFVDFFSGPRCVVVNIFFTHYETARNLFQITNKPSKFLVFSSDHSDSKPFSHVIFLWVLRSSAHSNSYRPKPWVFSIFPSAVISMGRTERSASLVLCNHN